MTDDLWKTLWRAWILIVTLKAIEEVVEGKDLDRGDVQIDLLEDHPEPVRAAILRWAHQTGCEPSEVRRSLDESGPGW